MTKKEKLELEIIAIKLWFKEFHFTKLCSDSQSNYMGKKLNKLNDELTAPIWDGQPMLEKVIYLMNEFKMHQYDAEKIATSHFKDMDRTYKIAISRKLLKG